MKQDDLIKMAKEAGFETRLFNSIDGDEIVVGDYFLTDRLKDFANLVAEATKAQPQDMKECRHCGWLCKPNDAPRKKGYVLAHTQCEWVDLTDEEIEQLYLSNPYGAYYYIGFSREVITKFKSKNTPPVVPQEPVAKVDANDEGIWADILPDRDVKVGQFLYATPPSVEAAMFTQRELDLSIMVAVEATKEKAAKVCEEIAGQNPDTALTCAAAIRSMK